MTEMFQVRLERRPMSIGEGQTWKVPMSMETLSLKQIWTWTPCLERRMFFPGVMHPHPYLLERGYVKWCDLPDPGSSELQIL